LSKPIGIVGVPIPHRRPKHRGVVRVDCQDRRIDGDHFMASKPHYFRRIVSLAHYTASTLAASKQQRERVVDSATEHRHRGHDADIDGSLALNLTIVPSRVARHDLETLSFLHTGFACALQHTWRASMPDADLVLASAPNSAGP
jgi:hypothetical protein